MKALIILAILLSAVVTGPVAFATCLKGLGLYAGGAGAALSTCATTFWLPPAYIACVCGICGLGGGAIFAGCIGALMAPTP